MKQQLFQFLAFIFLLTSCEVRKPQVVKTKIILSDTEKVFSSYQKFEENPLQPVKFNSKVEIDLSGKSLNLNAEIYIEPNNKIWATVYFMGFMGGKALITPSEIKGYEKLNRNYIQENFSTINKKLNIEGLEITFDDFQKILMGRLFFTPNPKNYQYNASQTGYELLNLTAISQTNSKETNNKESYVEKIIFDLDFKPIELLLKDNKGKIIQVKYENWEITNELIYPKDISITSLHDDKIKFHLEHKNATITKWNPPFEIPENYKKRSL